MPTPRAAERLLTFGAGLLGLMFAVRALFLLWSPYPTDYGEGTVWTYARLLEERGTYFLPIDQDPYIHGTYPPVFPRLHHALGGTLASGRALALFGTLLAAASIVSLLRQHGLGRSRALLWGVVFLGLPSVHEWAAMCRVDTLALGLSLLGLRVAGRHRGELLAAPIFGAAFFAKQIALAAPAAVFLALVWDGKRRRAVAFAALYGALVVTVFVVMNQRSDGEVARHLVTYTGFPGLALGELASWVLRFVFTFPVLLPLGLANLHRIGRSPVTVYVVLALLMLALTGKPGATANYLLEPGAACLLAGAIAAERKLTDVGSLFERRQDFVLLLIVQLVAICDPGRPLELRELLREQRAQAPAVAALRAAAPGPVLADDLGLTLAAGRTPRLEPFQFWLLAEAGLFDPEPVLAELRSGRYQLVLAGWRLRNMPGLVEVLEQEYRLDRRIGGYDAWYPRNSAER